MKKIINGLRYDTDKAVEVGSCDNGIPTNDFSHWSATLYKTPRSGKFFLAGHGGPMTQFARYYADGTRSGGENLIPMSDKDALAWAEQYLDADTIEEYFDINEA